MNSIARNKYFDTSWSEWKRFRGLLWCEWYSHSRLLLTFLIAWLVGIWVLNAMVNPVWIVVLGGVYSFFAGVLFGGSDVIQGIEEFSMSLPPTRRQRYLARLVLGGGSVLVINTMSLIALGDEIPQFLASLSVRAGIGATGPVNLLPFYGLIYGVPMASFAISYVLSLLGRSRVFVLISWVWGALVTIFILQFGIFYEERFIGEFTGRVSLPLLFLAAFGVLVIGYRFFCKKEPGDAGPPIAMPAKWWLWVLLLILGVTSGTVAASYVMEKYKAFFVNQ